MTPRNKNLVLHRIFLTGMLLLALNDHIFKQQYHNWLTGKLSDFAGLLIFPMFLAFLFPRLATHPSPEQRSHFLYTARLPLLAGLFFIFWKSPASTPLITLYNKFAPIGITRVVDYTDLLALAVLPFSHRLIQNIERYKINTHPNFHPRPIWLILPCSLIFMATAPPYYYRSRNATKGDIYLDKTYRTKLPPQQVLDIMQKDGYAPRQDTAYKNDYVTGPFYIIEHIPLPEAQDTLRSIQFAMKGDSAGSSITIYNINLNKPVNLGSWKMLRSYTRWYKSLVKKYVIKEVQ